MQAYELHAATDRPTRVRQRAPLSPLDFLEPTLLLGVGFFALAPDRFAPRTILIALATLLAPYLLRWLFYGAPSRSTPADLPLALLFLVLTPISLWVSPYFWENSWPEFVRMAWGGAVCMAVINWARPLWGRLDTTPATLYRLPPRLWILTFSYLALGLGLGFLGLLNMNIATKLPWLDQAARAFQTLKTASDIAVTADFNPNRVAAVLVLLAPLPLAFLIGGGRTSPPTVAPAAVNPLAATGRRRTGRRVMGLVIRSSWRIISKGAWLTLWLALVGGVLLTQSRTGLLATAMGTLVVLALTLRQPGGWLRLIGALFLMFFLLSMSYTLLPPSLMTFFQALPAAFEQKSDKLLNTNSLSGRPIIWQRALNGLADQPLTGMGLAAFDRIAHEPYPLPGYVPGDIHHAHNLFLQTALDFGVPGLLVFGAIVVLMAAGLLKLYRAVPPGGQLSVWTVGMIGCFVAFLLYNNLDAVTLGARPAVVLWFLLGLALSAWHLPARAGTRRPQHGKTLRQQ